MIREPLPEDICTTELVWDDKQDATGLLVLGDDVVIGGEVHLSGHTVEGGIVKTGRVRIGPRVTIGLGTAIGIDVVVGADCQVGALSVVPKHATLEPGTVYAGIPVHDIRRSAVEPAAHL